MWEFYDPGAQLSFHTTDENDRGVAERTLEEVKWDEEPSPAEPPPEEVLSESPPSQVMLLLQPPPALPFPPPPSKPPDAVDVIGVLTEEKVVGKLLTFGFLNDGRKVKEGGGALLELQKICHLFNLVGQLSEEMKWAFKEDCHLIIYPLLGELKTEMTGVQLGDPGECNNLGWKHETPLLIARERHFSAATTHISSEGAFWKVTLETWNGVLKVLDKMTVRGSTARIVRYTGSSNLGIYPDFDYLHAYTLILESMIQTFCGAICFMTWGQYVEKISQAKTTAVYLMRLIEGVVGMLSCDLSLILPSNFAFSGILEEVASRIFIQDYKRLIDFMLVGKLNIEELALKVYRACSCVKQRGPFVVIVGNQLAGFVGIVGNQLGNHRMSVALKIAYLEFFDAQGVKIPLLGILFGSSELKELFWPVKTRIRGMLIKSKMNFAYGGFFTIGRWQQLRVNDCIIQILDLQQLCNMAHYFQKLALCTILEIHKYEALYGRKPPVIVKGDENNSSVGEVQQLTQERNVLVGELREQLSKVQNRMKQYTDKHRGEVSFEVGELEYLMIQPYKLKQVAKRYEMDMLVMQALIFDRETHLYIAAGGNYGGGGRPTQMRAAFPKIVTKGALLVHDELRQFENHSLQKTTLHQLRSWWFIVEKMGHTQWEPEGNHESPVTSLALLLCFKLWDPGGRSLSLLFFRDFHLEDKVNFEGGSIDENLALHNSIGQVYSRKGRKGINEEFSSGVGRIVTNLLSWQEREKERNQ